MEKRKHQKHLRKHAINLFYVENLIVDSDLKNIEEEYLSEPTDKKQTETLKTVEQKALTQSKEYSPPETVDRATLNLIYKAVKDNADENGWAI